MNSSKRKYHSQIEITDLVAEAVSNAAARRNQVLDSEEPLSSLSDGQAGSVTGGGILQHVIVVGGDILGLGTSLKEIIPWRLD